MQFTSGKMLCGLATLSALAMMPAAQAAPVSHYSVVGAGNIGDLNADTLGAYNVTTRSVAIETIIDFNALVDTPTDAIILYDFGGSGTGSALVLNNNQLHYFASNSNSFVATGNHGLTAPQDDVQIVTVFELGEGTGTNELMSLYVNGALIGSADVASNNDWAGGESGSELGEESGTQRYNGTGLFTVANVINYPDPQNISLNIYELNNAQLPDNTLENILVSTNVIPSPSAALFGAVALGGMVLRRRRCA